MLLIAKDRRLDGILANDNHRGADRRTKTHTLLSLDKIPCASEIDNFRNFLRLAFWYEFHPCSTSCAFGLASSIGSFARANPC
jgi:hypothetical protein